MRLKRVPIFMFSPAILFWCNLDGDCFLGDCYHLILICDKAFKSWLVTSSGHIDPCKLLEKIDSRQSWSYLNLFLVCVKF